MWQPQATTQRTPAWHLSPGAPGVLPPCQEELCHLFLRRDLPTVSICSSWQGPPSPCGPGAFCPGREAVSSCTEGMLNPDPVDDVIHARLHGSRVALPCTCIPHFTFHISPGVTEAETKTSLVKMHFSSRRTAIAMIVRIEEKVGDWTGPVAEQSQSLSV